MNLFLLIGIVLGITWTLGKILEKIYIPWVFAALVVGIFYSYGVSSFQLFNTPEEVSFLGKFGMYLLLFLLGLEINIKQLSEGKGFYLESALFIIFLEAALGSVFIHYVFHYEWFVSFIVSLSFATVGEAILLPILERFSIINTKLGQAIIGIGITDDIIEILSLILVIAYIGEGTENVGPMAGISILLFGLVFLFFKAKRLEHIFKGKSREITFVFALFFLCLFLGVAEHINAEPLAAILSGVLMQYFLSKKDLEGLIENTKTIGYGFFIPLFFFWVGASVDTHYLITSPLLILLVVLISNGMKLLGSIIMGKKHLGFKPSIILGVGLSVRFSTSIVIINILHEHGVVGKDLFSVIIASSVIFTFMIPIVFSQLLVRWNIAKIPKTEA